LVVAVRPLEGEAMRILAGGGGAAIAAHTTNVLYSIRLEWRRLDWRQVYTSYAREWVGKVTWHIDNKGVIENLWRMPSCV
jgi:hypothetical protein